MKTSIFLTMSLAIISCGKDPYHGGTVVDSKAKTMVVTEKTVETQVTYLSELYPNSIVVEYLKSEQGPGVDQPFEVKNSTGRGISRPGTRLPSSKYGGMGLANKKRAT